MSRQRILLTRRRQLHNMESSSSPQHSLSREMSSTTQDILSTAFEFKPVTMDYLPPNRILKRNHVIPTEGTSVEIVEIDLSEIDDLGPNNLQIKSELKLNAQTVVQEGLIQYDEYQCDVAIVSEILSGNNQGDPYTVNFWNSIIDAYYEKHVEHILLKKAPSDIAERLKNFIVPNIALYHQYFDETDINSFVSLIKLGEDSASADLDTKKKENDSNDDNLIAQGIPEENKVTKANVENSLLQKTNLDIPTADDDRECVDSAVEFVTMLYDDLGSGNVMRAKFSNRIIKYLETLQTLSTAIMNRVDQAN